MSWSCVSYLLGCYILPTIGIRVSDDLVTDNLSWSDGVLRLPPICNRQSSRPSALVFFFSLETLRPSCWQLWKLLVYISWQLGTALCGLFSKKKIFTYLFWKCALYLSSAKYTYLLHTEITIWCKIVSTPEQNPYVPYMVNCRCSTKIGREIGMQCLRVSPPSLTV
jgi:hypothetical protein